MAVNLQSRIRPSPMRIALVFWEIVTVPLKYLQYNKLKIHLQPCDLVALLAYFFRVTKLDPPT